VLFGAPQWQNLQTRAKKVLLAESSQNKILAMLLPRKQRTVGRKNSLFKYYDN